MKLEGRDGSAFGLKILRYEFPELADEPYNADWLMIRYDVRTTEFTWANEDPCLLTFEVVQLANWLEALGDSRPVEVNCEFIEPFFFFERRVSNEGSAILRINFDPWGGPDAASEDLDPNAQYHIDFHISDLDLQAAGAVLRENLRQFPQRAEY